MKNYPIPQNEFTVRFNNRVRWIIISIGFFTVIYEVYTHFKGQSIHFDFDFFIELVLFVGIIPYLSILAFRWLYQSELEHNRVTQQLDAQKFITAQFTHPENTENLYSPVVQAPSLFLPVIISNLYIFDSEMHIFESRATWKQASEMEIPENVISSSYPPYCKTCQTPLFGKLHKFSPEGDSGSDKENIYCFPLGQNDKFIALIRISLPQGYSPSQQELTAVSDIANYLYLATDRANLQFINDNRFAAVVQERRHIAQDLHDTLGQNIAFLRLKLDSLLFEGENTVQGISNIRHELERMRTIADIAYNQVRETLADLQPENNFDLSVLIVEHTHMIADRAGFKISFKQEGKPVPLRPFIKRQVMYIIREGIANIEKHAKANIVKLTFNWSKTYLDILLSDDGKGFLPDNIDTRHHFGLSIMRERAESVHAQFEINSTPQQGTILSLKIPLTQYQIGINPEPNNLERTTRPVFFQDQPSFHQDGKIDT